MFRGERVHIAGIVREKDLLKADMRPLDLNLGI